MSSPLSLLTVSFCLSQSTVMVRENNVVPIYYVQQLSGCALVLATLAARLGLLNGQPRQQAQQRRQQVLVRQHRSPLRHDPSAGRGVSCKSLREPDPDQQATYEEAVLFGHRKTRRRLRRSCPTAVTAQPQDMRRTRRCMGKSGGWCNRDCSIRRIPTSFASSIDS